MMENENEEDRDLTDQNGQPKNGTRVSASNLIIIIVKPIKFYRRLCN